MNKLMKVITNTVAFKKHRQDGLITICKLPEIWTSSHKWPPRLANFSWLIIGGLTLLKSMYCIFKVQNLCMQHT